MYKKVKAKKKMAFLQINNDNFMTDKTVSHLAGINPGMVYIYMLMLMATSTDGFPGILQYGDSDMYTYTAALIGKPEKLSLIKDTLTALINLHAAELHDGIIVFIDYYKYIGEAYKDTCTYNAYCKAKSESEKKEKRTVENKSGTRFTIPKRKIEEWKTKYKYINVENVIDEYIATNIDSEKKEKVLMSIAHVLIEANNKAIDKLLAQAKPAKYATVTNGMMIADYNLTADDINALQCKYKYIDVAFILDSLKADMESGKKNVKCIKSAITNRLRAHNDMAKKEEAEKIITSQATHNNNYDAKYEALLSIYADCKVTNTATSKAYKLWTSIPEDEKDSVLAAAYNYMSNGINDNYRKSLCNFISGDYKKYTQVTTPETGTNGEETVREKLPTGCEYYEALDI